MNDIKANIRRIFWLYVAMFAMVVLYLGNFIINSHNIVNSPYNPRLNLSDKGVKRGSIYDANGAVIAESILIDGEYQRVCYYGGAFAHTAGFSGLSKSGIEAKYNFDMQRLDREVLQRGQSLIKGSELEGNSLHLTLDANLQQRAFQVLGDTKGAVVALEPSTGKVLAMVSSPSFDPSNMDWDTLSRDDENSPLLNRATQGLYPPGSIFKLVTSAAIMDNMENWEEYYYQCGGDDYFGDTKIRCFDSTAHGLVNLETAIKQSCNTYFASALMEIGPQALDAAASLALFNTSYPFNLERVSSRFTLDSDAMDYEIVQTAIGQGKTLVTPLHMAMVAAAVANGGMMPVPYMVEKITSKGGSTKTIFSPQEQYQVFTTEQAGVLRDMMVLAVSSGTGRAASIEGIEIAGKTGTAETASGEAHGWFIAFAPAKEPQIVLAVLTENTGGARKSLEIAKSLFSFALIK